MPGRMSRGDADAGKPVTRARIVRDQEERVRGLAQHMRDAIDHALAVHALESLRATAISRRLPAREDHARAGRGHV